MKQRKMRIEMTKYYINQDMFFFERDDLDNGELDLKLAKNRKKIHLIVQFKMKYVLVRQRKGKLLVCLLFPLIGGHA